MIILPISGFSTAAPINNDKKNNKSSATSSSSEVDAYVGVTESQNSPYRTAS